MSMIIENIKFKAKRLDNNTWVEGYLYAECGNTYIIEDRQSESMLNRNEAHQVDHLTVCQFTGLKDCEGNEVWEGDLLQSQITESIYEIVWHKFLGFIMKNPRSGGHLSETLGCLLQLGKFKVIGNKFDNDK